MIFDVPRVTTIIRDAIQPTNSSVIYNTTENRYEYYDGSSWKAFGEGGVISFNTRTGEITLLDSDIASLGDFTVSGTITINNDIILGSEALKIMSSANDPNVSGVIANTGSIILQSDGSLWQKLGSGNTNWSKIQLGEFTGEPTGFPIDSDGEVNRSDSSISFNNTNRTFSISPTGTEFFILIKGKQFRKTSTESIQISTSEGLHHIYYDLNGDLQTSTQFSLDLILKYVYVSVIYWDSSNSKQILFADERHGCNMDSHTHARIHQESGAVYVSGMAPSNFTVDGDGSNISNLTFSVGSGFFRDEDILHSLSDRNSNQIIPIFYRNGSDWRLVEPTISGGSYPRAIGTDTTPGQIAYNLYSGGTWSRESVPNNNFVCYHLIATNDINNPYFLIMGINSYATKPLAQTAAISEISSLTGLPFSECVFIATILYECKTSYSNSLLSRIVSTDGSNFIDWRFRIVLNPVVANITTHNNLGGLYGSGNFYHSNQPILTSDSVTFNGISSTSNLDVSGTSTLTTTNMTTGNISNELSVTGTSTLTNANLSGNLNVTGTSTQTTVNMTTGNISGNLNVTGTSTQTNVNMTTNNISGELNVTGTSTLSTVNMTTGNISGALSVTGTSTLTNANLSGNLSVSGTSNLNSVDLSGNLTIGGNLIVNGTTTTVNSTITTLQDPIIVLGLSPASIDDNKDRGIAFNYNNGSPKIGFFGFNDSTGRFTFIPDATITNEVISGPKGTLDANLDWSNLLNIPSFLSTTGGIITGNLTITGNTNINSALNVSGTSTLNTVDFNGNATFNGDITANIGTSTFKFGNIGTLTVTSALNVNNGSTSNFTGAINVTGTSTLTTTNMTTANVSGALNVTGTSTFATTNMTTANVTTALNVTGTGTFTNISLGSYSVRTGMSSIQSTGTVDLSASRNLIYYFNYVAASGTVTSGSINFTNGLAGEIVYVRVNSNASYTFGANMKFPSDIAPTQSANGKVDLYSFLCINSNLYYGTFAFNYT